jgi:hypothetical protein
MGNNVKTRQLVALAAATLLAGAANAGTSYTYVGTWTVDQGPVWASRPIAYTGQEAAALLFGGKASDYVISTIDSSVADIDFSAWYSVIGYGEAVFADDYASKLPNGKYYDGGSYSTNLEGPASAYVADNSAQRNFAFRVSSVPEPANLALMLAGVGLVGLQVKRRRSRTTA